MPVTNVRLRGMGNPEPRASPARGLTAGRLVQKPAASRPVGLHSEGLPVPNQTRGISYPALGGRAANDAASSSPTIISLEGSHEIVRPSRAAIAARWQVFIAMM